LIPQSAALAFTNYASLDMRAPADMTRQGRRRTWNKHKTPASDHRQCPVSNALKKSEDIGAGSRT